MENLSKNQTYLDILFLNRNKEYGAYELRIHYEQRLLKSIAITCFGLLFSIFIFSKFKTQRASTTHYIPVVFENVRLKPLEYNQPKSSPINQKEIYKNELKKEDLVPIIAKDQNVKDKKVDDKPIKFNPDMPVNSIGKDAPNKGFSSAGFSDGGDVDLKPNIVIKEKTREEVEKIDDFSEVDPQFPGGEKALIDFLNDNVRYPKMAQENSIEGRVTLSFVVYKDGSIGDIKIIQDIGYGCGEEGIRVMKTMPKWTPGLQNGHKVNVRYSVPIHFRLE